MTVSQNDRIPLPGDRVYQGTAGDIDYTLTYVLTPEAPGSGGEETIGLSGTVSRNRPLEKLIVRLSFLDATGRVMDTQTVYSSASRRWRDGARYHEKTSSVQGSFTVPAGAESIAFSATAEEKRNIGGR